MHIVFCLYTQNHQLPYLCRDIKVAMRHFLNFLKSKTFLFQLVLAGILLVAICILMLQWLKNTTQHGVFVTVPDCSKMSVMDMRKVIETVGLRYQVLDSSDYNPEYPRFSIIDQTPPAGSKVKANRKVYFTINPSGYRKVTVPDIVQVTRRNATSMLRAVGLEVQRVTYINELGKDMIYQLKYQGNYIKPGDKLPKTSKIELICGNGIVPQKAREQSNTL